jgi:hypothetical protein
MGYLLSRKPGAAATAARAARARPESPNSRTARRSTADRKGPGDKHSAGEKHATGEKRGPADRRAAGDGRGAGEKRAAGDKRNASDRRGGEKKSGGDKRSTRPAGSAPLFYRGPVPRRRLRLAEFLYYTGRVSWQSLISAIVWQRASQPRFGELARELQGISSQDLARILGSRLQHEQTGQTAQRLRLLNAAQVERILRMQRARHKLIGRYFVEKESISTATLSTIMREMYRHNVRYGRQE